MAKYRKKPVVIDAIHISRILYFAESDWKSMPDWVEKHYDAGNLLFLNMPPRVEIRTLEGTHTGNYDDMLIQGVNGEIYPCKPDIFGKTYELVED